MSGGDQPIEAELKELLPLAVAAGFRPPFKGDAREASSIAYHEAGHIIAGLACGRTLNFVTIEPGKEAADFQAIVPRSYEDVTKLLKTGLGGPIAEQQRFAVSWGFLEDMRGIRVDLAPHLAGRKEEDVLRPLGEWVQKTLKRNRASLDAVVKALLETPTLDGEQVAKLVKLE